MSASGAVLAMAYIGLGSNLSDPVRQVQTATQALAAMPSTDSLRCSSLYRSAPVGAVRDQPDFINAVCRLETRASARELMAALLAIEQAQGRVRNGQHGGPRVIDLDLLLYDGLVSSEPGLVLPHPRLHERAFVLYPLHELDPTLVIPGKGPVAALLEHCRAQSVERIAAK